MEKEAGEGDFSNGRFVRVRILYAGLDDMERCIALAGGFTSTGEEGSLGTAEDDDGPLSSIPVADALPFRDRPDTSFFRRGDVVLLVTSDGLSESIACWTRLFEPRVPLLGRDAAGSTSL